MSLGEAQVRVAAKREALIRRLSRVSAESRAEFNDLAGYNRWMARWSPWLSRVAIAISLCAGIVGMSFTLYGLWVGEIGLFVKFSSSRVSRAENPFSFWLSICGYGGMSGFWLWLALNLYWDSHRRDSSI